MTGSNVYCEGKMFDLNTYTRAVVVALFLVVSSCVFVGWMLYNLLVFIGRFYGFV